MFSFGNRKLGLESYKGVRDFYPEDWAIERYIFNVMRKTVESWGYSEYNASLLEPSDLYKEKTSSEEIVSKETYTFVDRGGREVTLRPEMTPTVARMLSARVQELPLPVRWYSIPNLFRYEKPQRGRLREHYQLNVDIFGSQGVSADIEVVTIASDIMKAFGASNNDFEIRINSRMVLDELFNMIDLKKDLRLPLCRLIDKKEKISEDDFKKSISNLIGDQKTKDFLEKLYFGEALLTMLVNNESVSSLNQIIDSLRARGIDNVVFSPTLTRGFDYYTGAVFEVFDKNKENPRSIFGGGRYDNLSQSFINQSVPAVGFGMGDVTIKDFLLTHNLLPEISSPTSLYIAVVPGVSMEDVYRVAKQFRDSGINTAVDVSEKKLASQLSLLDKRKVKYVITIGEEEIKTGNLTLRNTVTREESSGTVLDLIKVIKG
jgi:histidyl-tRNA synthetase